MGFEQRNMNSWMNPVYWALNQWAALLPGSASATTVAVCALPIWLFCKELILSCSHSAFRNTGTGSSLVYNLCMLSQLPFHSLTHSHVYRIKIHCVPYVSQLSRIFTRFLLQTTSSPPSPEAFIFPACISECTPLKFLTGDLSTVECQYLGGPFANADSLQFLGGQLSARFLTCSENTDLLQGNRQHSKSYKGCHWKQFF